MGSLNAQIFPSAQMIVVFVVMVLIYKMLEVAATRIFARIFPTATSKESDEINYLKSSYARLKADLALVRGVILIMAVKLEIDPEQLKDLIGAG